MTPAFADYHQTLDDAALMPRHAKLGEKVFMPVRPSSFTGTPDSARSTSSRKPSSPASTSGTACRPRITTDLPAHQRLDEAVTTPGEESVRRALATQLIITREWGLKRN
jgi:hypothetical protein